MNAVVAMVCCRHCGSDLTPSTVAQVESVVGFQPLKCSGNGCRRNYVMKVELISIENEASWGRV